MAKTNKQTRRELHSAINALTRDELAAIVHEQHPRGKGKRIDELAKDLIAKAHRVVSPRT